MLTALTIRDVVLIDQLTLDFAAGLGVMTGETGAGKSILLDSLGLALGARADASLVRSGTAGASVTAEFAVAPTHPVHALLADNDIAVDESLLLRRTVKADGGSRAFINDQPVGIGLLRDVGSLLVEIHGQHDDRGLLNPKGHRALLDAFAGHDKLSADVACAWANWQETVTALAAAQAEIEAAERDRAYLEHAAAELGKLQPEPDEEQRLAEERGRILRGEKMADDLQATADLLGGSDGALTKLRQAARRLERIAEADRSVKAVLDALDRAVHEATDGEDQLATVMSSLVYDPAALDRMETRLFDLRGLARKYRVSVADLPAVLADVEQKLERLSRGTADVAALTQKCTQTRDRYAALAEKLTASRQKSAKKLNMAVAEELAPLKLDKARFQTVLELLPESDWSGAGRDRVSFEISTNPGAPFGPLAKIASGGELSRFILALKVALAAQGTAGTLIFDEIDHGVGGAVASAIGDRLSRLAHQVQVLVVTHSPQVAASGGAHWLIEKQADKKTMRTQVRLLDDAARREEIARMLSGDTVTNEARAQADKLLAAA
jgi:DNA repair protein RecN (Recombination protein N)